MFKVRLEFKIGIPWIMPLNARRILDIKDTHALLYDASEIGNNKNDVYDFTAKWSNIALICNGSRVLGFGYIGVGPPKS